MQISLNLAYGSAMASIGLTIPTIAVASIWLDGPLALGLGATQMVLLLLSVIVGVLTVVPGRAKPLKGGLHLVILAAYIFLIAIAAPDRLSRAAGTLERASARGHPDGDRLRAAGLLVRAQVDVLQQADREHAGEHRASRRTTRTAAVRR